MHTTSPASLTADHIRSAASPKTISSPALQRLIGLFVDRRMSVSRPKVLFTVAVLDGMSILLSSFAAAWFAAAPDAGTVDDVGQFGAADFKFIKQTTR